MDRFWFPTDNLILLPKRKFLLKKRPGSADFSNRDIYDDALVVEQ
jgi:hypothetical protein